MPLGVSPYLCLLRDNQRVISSTACNKHRNPLKQEFIPTIPFPPVAFKPAHKGPTKKGCDSTRSRGWFRCASPFPGSCTSRPEGRIPGCKKKRHGGQLQVRAHCYRHRYLRARTSRICSLAIAMAASLRLSSSNDLVPSTKLPGLMRIFSKASATRIATAGWK